MEPNEQPNQDSNQEPSRLTAEQPESNVTPANQAPHQPKGSNNKPILIGLAALAVLVLAVMAVTMKSDHKAKTPTPATGTTTQQSRQATITITKDGFTPASLTIKQGTKVTWTNTDTAPHAIASDPHPTHTGLKGLESANLTDKGTYSFTFDKPGTYTYHDHLNPYKFHGTVVVE